MSENIIQYAFVAGEVSPKLFGRADLEKYELGLSKSLNWFVDYRGGLTTRPGTNFVDFLENPTSATKFVPFQYSPDTANTYNIVFGDGYIRFIQDGAYVVESGVSISWATAADPCVVTANAHGYSNGDWVRISGIVGMTELNGRTFEVANVTTNTFELKDVITDANLDSSAYTAYGSAGDVYRIYTISNPYAAADLAKLKAYQIDNLVRLTHPDYKVRNLVRSGATSWALSLETTDNDLDAPTGVTLTQSGSGSAGVGFVVTSVDVDGNESVGSIFAVDNALVDYASTAGNCKVTWTAATNAVYYKVYRTQILSDGAQVHGGMELGYIGQTTVPYFTDDNITPDFTKSPPIHYDPFADGAIESIVMTNAGSGYTSVPTVGVTGGGGSGFVGYAVRDDDSDTIIGVVVINRGTGYSSPTVSFTGGGGASAAATATAGAASGNDPAVSTKFQQRQVYAATSNNPLRITASQPALLSNFDYSAIGVADDSYDYSLDTDTVAPIRHLLAVRGGLLVMSQAGIWQLTGGENLVVSGQNAIAEPQSFFGAADVPPLTVDTNVLYLTEKESTVRLLSYNDFSKIYGGQDMSILSNHLFMASNKILKWAYQETPNRIVWCVKQDGTLLSFTIVNEQNVFAWCRNNTQGKFKDVVSIEENGLDVTYVAVERQIGSNTVLMVERFAERDFTYIEDAICTDSTLSLGSTSPAATLDADGYLVETTVTLTAGSSVFSSGDVGSIIRMGGGKLEITTYTSGTSVDAYVLREITDRVPETEGVYQQASGSWTMDAPVTTISGLWHLEGMTVRVLGDGNVMVDATVTNGSITLESGVTRVSIGLGFTCQAQTLPPTYSGEIIEGRRKDINGMAIRMNETRGLKLGPDLTQLKEMKDRTNEVYGEPIEPRSEITFELTDTNWDEEGQMWMVQDYPLPASILSLIKNTEFGDDKD